MNNHSKVTIKGQITLPSRFREEMGLEAGDIVVVSKLDERTLSVRLPLDITGIRRKVGQPSHRQPLTAKEKQQLAARGLLQE